MPDLDLAGAAAVIGRSYSWFQRHWRTLRHPRTDAAFPQPFLGALPGQRPLWLRADVEAWKAGQATPGTAWDPAQRAPSAAPANDPTPRPVTDTVAALIAAAGG